MNYSKIVDQDGEVLGYLATEPGNPNETTIVDRAHDMGLKLIPATEEEYNSTSDEFEEIKPDWME